MLHKSWLAPLCLALLTTAAPAETILGQADGVTILAEPIATDLRVPVLLTSPPGDPRLFVVEKTGEIRIIGERGTFLDISRKVSNGSEQGLLGLAFHPDFANNQRFFVYYTDRRGMITVAEGLASKPNALTTILTVPHFEADNHNGGWLDFGPDGLLYIGTGDGGARGDPWGNGQNPDVLLGKLLRIDVDAAKPYAIPASNPFANGGGAPEIFAIGLRNPWRAAFDGDQLYIADVGQSTWEEVHILTTADAGANLGWKIAEGLDCFEAATCDMTGLTPPVHVYDHDQGCSITGGYVYRGTAMPALQGRYFFSDFCSGNLMSFRLSDGSATQIIGMKDATQNFGQITSFGRDAAGELYLLTADGTVAKLVPAPN